ncbi:MAG: hypothetical protein JSU04_11910 [Bdellovibrionales bacterium]|nr:hypothetical protein [Bdellovibrionales bacterium]
MKKYMKLALGVLTVLLVSGGCQRDKTEPDRDPLDANYQLIDKGDYDGAIRELQKLALEDQRPSVKVALASAYAARGGIRVENYWGFVIGFDAPLVPPDSIPTNATIESLQKIAKQAKGDIDPRDLNALGGIVNALSVWERYKDRVDAIPVVTGAALADVQIAAETLKTVQTPGGRLYRAILNLILFKSYITASQGLWDQFNAAIAELLAGHIEVLCKFDFEKILNWLNPITYHLTETLDDLIIAYPDERKDLEGARNIVQAVYGFTQQAVDELRKKRMCRP